MAEHHTGIAVSARSKAAEDAVADRAIRPARERLLQEALRIFSEKGYANASTREIARAAEVNVASIHYYFGDKEGLYRAALTRPISEVAADFPLFGDPGLGLEPAMRAFFGAFLRPLSRGDDCALAMRLHLREMIEPTPVLRDVLEQNILPYHRALVGLLARHCNAPEADDGLHQLAFAMVAMVNDYWMSRECMQILAPTLFARPDAMDRVLDRLVGYACALVEHETAQRARRTGPAEAVPGANGSGTTGSGAKRPGPGLSAAAATGERKR